MPLDFQQSLPEAFSNIGFQEHHSFAEYGQAQWSIIDVVNDRYNTILKDKFDLYHWLWYHEEDELAYFLIEAGSNAFHGDQNQVGQKVPTFHLWLGSRGFIVGVQQEKAFPALELFSQRTETGGSAFFQRAKRVIFFDNPSKTKTVYFLYPLNLIK